MSLPAPPPRTPRARHAARSGQRWSGLGRWRAALHWALAGLLAALVTLSLLAGSTDIGWRDVVAALAGPGGGAQADGAPAMAAAIVRDLRLPRVLLALAVGATLAMVGSLLQTTTRNDLADPFLFGLSSGASAGAVAVITLAGTALGTWTLPLATFAGALVAAAAVLLIVRGGEGQGAARIVLAGVSVSFLFGAFTHALIFAGDQRAAHSVVFWSLGGLGLARWDNLWLALAGLLVPALFVARRHRALDALLAGDDTAHSLGVDPRRLRTQTFVVAAFATACCVALTGLIGFVGLMVPHLARRWTGPLHGASTAAAAVIGAVLLLGSDLAARTLLGAQELPVGIVTSGLGACFVIALLRRGDGGA
ncbi:FecCD family ABC transporter permease [Acidovorax sp. NCPPB 4044]|uniref:FecCD family ABC transporter permease n=1 Tax=Acidovorax sp. NCPPB 4044 TaxID=2940490 RepID=UPI002303BF5F|nr:iron ABC transporter permease [Acidovorax sp. NCPPB 4044]MDA8520547.1 iron ABC transporter permease [Acidovorax sp. NCPPB 4044]